MGVVDGSPLDLFARAVRRQADGRLAEAEPLYHAVLAHCPGHALSLHMLGVIRLQSGRYADAHTLLSAALPLLADSAEIHRHLGVALQALGRLVEAAEAYREALRRRPDAVVWILLGLVHEMLGDNAGALASFTAAVALQPQSADAHNNLGAALDRAGRFDDAMAAYARALALQPGHAEALLNTAGGLRAAGQPLAARAAIERVLAADPAHAYAWFLLSEVKTFAPGDPDIARLEALQAPAGRDAKARADLAFALGKAKMDVGDADGAFASLAAANRIKRASFDYDVAADAARMARLAARFDAGFLQRHEGAGAASPAPIFILGMPRSGSTLLEQVLASHPAIAGAGELPIPTALSAGLDRAETAPGLDETAVRASLRQLGEDYLRQIAPFGAGHARVANKAIGLFLYAGLLHLMLPGARFIHCRRDPVDSCFSCYTKNFAEPQLFAYDLHELGAYHRAHTALMNHWRAVIPPGRFLEVEYEALTADLDGEARRLITFTGLDWDDACLDFHRNARRVGTASAEQVRQPIYRSSVGRWQAYERHLGPLLAALGLAAAPSG